VFCIAFGDATGLLMFFTPAALSVYRIFVFVIGIVEAYVSRVPLTCSSKRIQLIVDDAIRFRFYIYTTMRDNRGRPMLEMAFEYMYIFILLRTNRN